MSENAGVCIDGGIRTFVKVTDAQSRSFRNNLKRVPSV